MRALILTISLLVGFSSTAFAQGVGYFTTGNQSPSDKRTMRICVGGDIQNMVTAAPSSETSTVTPSMASCRPGQAGTCSGPYCTQSPYCKTSWFQTGHIILRNMTYSMIGRSDLMDYTGITGADTDYTHTYNRNHESCDLVLVVGDLQDSGDDSTDPPTDIDIAEWNAVIDNHLDILDKAGIPWVATQGNHDSSVMYTRIIDQKLQASPYFFNRATDGLSHALLIPTKMGQRMCVIGVRGNSTATGADPTFLGDNIGCGGGFPTIVMSHNSATQQAGSSVCGSGSDVSITNLVDDAGNEEVWLVASGHSTPNPPIYLCKQRLNPAAWAGTPALYRVNSNTQELDRHGYSTTVNAPYGNTTSDSEGGVYTVITINPVDKTIEMHDWNPYTQSTGNGQSYVSSTLFETFDWDARFPP